MEIITFNYRGVRTVSNLKENIYTCSKYITLDKKGFESIRIFQKKK